MLTLAIVVPLVVAAVTLAIPKRLEHLARPLAIATSFLPLVVVAISWARFDFSTGFQLVESAQWIPSLGISYTVGVDGLSLPLVALTALLFTVSMVFPFDVQGKPRAYFATFLFLEAISLGVFLSLDLILFFVFWDLSLVGMYFLIGIWGHGEDAKRSALKFFLYTLLGSLALLLGILGIYLYTDPRTFSMIEIIETLPVPAGGLAATLIFVAVGIGFAVKTPLVPLHTWLPPAHVDAPAPASTILAGVLLKMGTYGFIRISLQMLPETFQRFALPLAILAVVSILYGALVAMAQTNLKRLVAYTSVNHMGYVILGVAAAGAIGLGSEASRSIAMTGAVVEMVAHGLITGALFLLSGSIYARGKTYELDQYGGLAGASPRLSGIMMLAAFASLGLPGLAGFVAEFQIFAGTLGVFPWLAAIGLLGIVITAALFLRMIQQLFFGDLPARWGDWKDLKRAEMYALVPLAALVVVIGVVPQWLIRVIDTFSQMVARG
ncbi:NADH-ubiquinone oxidoreductase chain M [hydrothermal vent metagenome]|uniref:NADH-ubiquinone oxidoreductase chain M n=1 Tax=hydrothermal vent metagenome TaxID=652676 RepID=A0A3B0RTV9_9ZZZZ